MSVDLGRVMLVPKGAYDPTAEYTRLDIVTSGGSSYVCLVSNTGQPVTDATYWLLLAKAGSDGKPGADGAPGVAGKDGAPGVDGKDGATGPAGATGATGATGPQGIQGVKGDIGPRGATGAQGPAGKDAVSQILDTRSTNQLPGWYHTNNPKKVVTEFKQTAAIGITQALMPSGQTLGTYCSLTTETPWSDSSGGSVFQTAKLINQTRPVVLIRVGTSDTAWSAWELMTTW